MNNITLSAFIGILLTLTLTTTVNAVINTCTDNNCLPSKGQCVNGECICNRYYATLYIDNANTKNEMYCNYEKQTRWKPFIMELLLPTLGHFYIGNITLGLIKLGLLFGPVIIMIIAYGLSLLIKDDDNTTASYAPIICSIICVVLFTIMHVYDLIMYGIARYVDGYGVSLI
jgi:hypothetical protein